MNTSYTSRIGALAGAAALSTSILAVAAAPAFAAGVPGSATGNPAGYGTGYGNVINNHGAATELIKIENGDTVEVFCIDEPAAYDSNPETVYSSAAWAASGVPGLAKAADIAVNADNKGTPLADPKAEIVARQLAIWSYTNNTDYSAVKNASIRNRADAIKAAAVARDERNSSVVLTLKSSSTEGKNTVVAHMENGAGAPLKNEYVALSGTDINKTVQTDAQGNASATFAAAKSEVKVDATWTGVLPAGSVLVPATGKQKVITTKDAKISRSASVTLAAAPAPVVPSPEAPAPVVPSPAPAPVVPSPEAPAPTVAPTTPAPVVTTAPPVAAPVTPVTTKKELPYTGSPITLPLILGSAGLVGFGAWARRKRGGE